MRLHIVGFLLLIHVLTTRPLSAQGPSSLEWGRFIGYKDFQASAPQYDTAAASISVTILLGYSSTKSGTLAFRVVAVMDKKQSWIKDEYKKDHILRHEQGHFDIAHIYAKKLEASLKLRQYTSRDTVALNHVYDRHLEEMNGRQIRYDVETKGGWDLLAQSKWRRIIAGELRK